MSGIPAAELRSLCVHAGGREVLSRVSAVFRTGEIAVLCGRVGSGKTLLAHSIAGIRKPQLGTVRLNGYRVAMIFQDAGHGLIGETVMDDLLFAAASAGIYRSEAKTKALSLLTEMGLERLSERYTITLSGGESRLVAIAGAILSGAGLIIADEPFVNLDWPSVQTVLRSILRLRENGASVVVITHEVEKVLAHTDHLLVIDSGKLVLNRRFTREEELSDADRAILKNAGIRIIGSRTEQSWL